MEDDSTEVMVNGKVNNRGYNLKQRISETPLQLAPLDKGRIALQCEGAELYYRRIELMDLTETPVAIGPALRRPEGNPPVSLRSEMTLGVDANGRLRPFDPAVLLVGTASGSESKGRKLRIVLLPVPAL